MWMERDEHHSVSMYSPSKVMSTTDARNNGSFYKEYSKGRSEPHVHRTQTDIGNERSLRTASARNTIKRINGMNRHADHSMF
jgi:hypothetical protein